MTSSKVGLVRVEAVLKHQIDPPFIARECCPLQDFYLWALAGFAIVVTALAWNVPRAPGWVALQALSFLSSGFWHDAGLPYGAAWGAFTNLAVIAALFAYAVLFYELAFWFCFMLMLVLDAIYLLNLFPSHSYFAIGLELANWLALLSIGAAGMADRAGVGLAWVAVFRARPTWARALALRIRHPLSGAG